MQTPPHNATKGGRRSSKPNKQKDLTQRSVQSDNDAYQVVAQKGDQTPSKGNKGRQRRKSHAQKQGGAQSEAGEYSDGPPFKHTDRTKATPIKSQAYAGPTFHQSPAASALPLPSFYSRSVPNASSINPIAEVSDELNKTHTIEQFPGFPSAAKKECTPLDFLFDAARRAQATPPNGSTKSNSHLLSPPNRSPASRSPAPKEGDGDFPFELDAPDLAYRQGGSAHTTPFKDRLEAARSPRPSSEGQTLTEEQRREKTHALKKALMSPQHAPPQQNSMHSTEPDQLAENFNDFNPFNARNVAYGQQMQSPHRSHPSPPGPLPNGYNPNMNPPYYGPRQYSPNRSNNMNVPNRPPSSGLRNMYDPEPAELSSDSATNESRISTGRKLSATTQPNFASIYGSNKPSTPPTNLQQSPNNMQQGLHDLRKVLNLDLIGKG